jgi:HK97 family phage prohead protease
MEIKQVKMSLDDFSTQTGEFHGHAAVFGNVDSYKDITHSGAFKRTIENNGGIVPILDQHDMRVEIGLATQLREDEKGLAFTGKLYVSDDARDELPQARAAYVKMKRRQEVGKPMGLSFGYDAVKHDRDDKSGIRHLREVKLYEISVVTFGANPLASVGYVKNLDLLLQHGKLDPEFVALQLNGVILSLKAATEGKPFADYEDFADCVAKNQDKENPEAYCGEIQSRAEKAGRRISAATRLQIEGAISNLQSLLSSVDSPEGTPQEEDSVDPADNSAKSHLFADLIGELKGTSVKVQEDLFLHEIRSLMAATQGA